MRPRPTIAIFLGICAVAATPAGAKPTWEFTHWGSFTRTSSAFVSPRSSEQYEISHGRAWVGLKAITPEMWLIERTETVTSATGKQTTHGWADSRSCNGLIPSLSGLADLEAFAIQPPGLPWPRGRDQPPNASPKGSGDRQYFDTTEYEVAATGHWPNARMVGDVVLRGSGGPIAGWVEDTLRALQACWSPKPPT
ncbi:MAG TPA: hypothetical protein VG248_00255 [Caulobacteraceae bacterium]|jgi:hypothetical protein|nr:hypothetical protein [Caulobacteraceae bacterium]